MSEPTKKTNWTVFFTLMLTYILGVVIATMFAEGVGFWLTAIVGGICFAIANLIAQIGARR